MRSLIPLEWRLIQSELSQRTKSPIGQHLALAHTPYENADHSKQTLLRVKEARTLLDEKRPVFSFLQNTRDPSHALEAAHKGSVLSAEDLWVSNHLIETVALVGSEIKSYHKQDSSLCPLLFLDWEKSPPTPPICSQIRKAISSEGFILDTASPELKHLRDKRASKKKEFENYLETKLKSWNSSGFLQDNFFDIIDGRYVIPVKVSEQSKIQGALHGKSNTGQSVFIEPTELTTENNALKELDLSIRAEEYRILKLLSESLGSIASQYYSWVTQVASLDLIQSIATLSNEWGLCSSITLNNQSKDLNLKNLLHPALIHQKLIGLYSKDIVKNNISLNQTKSALIISGPNTGGKTVLLKAIGLTALMVKAGIPIPVEENSSIPLYSKIMAFIGDDQSISKGLSSFSAQIKDLRLALEEKQTPCLFLIDEILSSTDPEEASALAQAILEKLVEQGHHLVVTTHFAELAIRSKSNPKFKLAGMEFMNGAPTYRMIPDELGSSHAIEVAERLGLQSTIIHRARSLISNAKLDYLKAQKDLRQKETDLEDSYHKKIKEIEESKSSNEALYKSKIDTLESAVKTLLTELKEKAENEFNRWKESLSKTRIIKNTDKQRADLQKILNDIQEKAKIDLTDTDININENTHTESQFKVGDQVQVLSMAKANGTILELKKDTIPAKALVQAGAFKVLIELKDLKSFHNTVTNRSSQTNWETTNQNTDIKLDLRGKKYDEAISEAESYLDQSYRNGVIQVTVITGHGTGAIKKGFKELVKSLPYIKEFRPERQGDDGAWIVQFDY